MEALRAALLDIAQSHHRLPPDDAEDLVQEALVVCLARGVVDLPYARAVLRRLVRGSRRTFATRRRLLLRGVADGALATTAPAVADAALERQQLGLHLAAALVQLQREHLSRRLRGHTRAHARALLDGGLDPDVPRLILDYFRAVVSGVPLRSRTRRRGRARFERMVQGALSRSSIAVGRLDDADHAAADAEAGAADAGEGRFGVSEADPTLRELVDPKTLEPADEPGYRYLPRIVHDAVKLALRVHPSLALQDAVHAALGAWLAYSADHRISEERGGPLLFEQLRPGDELVEALLAALEEVVWSRPDGGDLLLRIEGLDEVLCVTARQDELVASVPGPLLVDRRRRRHPRQRQRHRYEALEALGWRRPRGGCRTYDAAWSYGADLGEVAQVLVESVQRTFCPPAEADWCVETVI